MLGLIRELTALSLGTAIRKKAFDSLPNVSRSHANKLSGLAGL